MTTWLVEHKTSSEDVGAGSFYWAKLTLDGQVSKYLRAARELGFEPMGVLYDVLRKPALKPLQVNSKRSTPETPAEYRTRVLADITERPDYYYQRGEVVRLESEERDAMFDDWQTAEQIRESRNAERWPRNVDSCEQYHRKCDYWEVCAGQRSIDDPLFYEKREREHEELDAKHRLPLLTASSSRAFRACPRRYYYAYELRMRPRASADALRFGTMIHVALEAWFMHESRDESALHAALLALYEHVGPKNTDTHEVAKAEAMITGYHARWIGDVVQVLAVEKEFAIDLRNPATGAASRTFALGGKIDAVIAKE